MATELLNIRIAADGARARTELDRTAKSIGGLGAALKMGAALGIGFGSGMEAARAALRLVGDAARAATRYVTSSIEETSTYGDRIAKASRALGVAAEDLQALAFAAARAGADQGLLERGLKNLARVMDDARSGSKEAAEVFGRLGVAVTDAEGRLRPTVAVFRDVADALQDQGSSAQTTADLTALLGRSGTELGSLMLEGSEGLDAMRARLVELGGVMSGDALLASEVYRDALDDLDVAAAALKRELGEGLLPVALGVALAMTDAAVVARTNLLPALDAIVERLVRLPSLPGFGILRGAAALGGALGATGRRRGEAAIEEARGGVRDAAKAARLAQEQATATRGLAGAHREAAEAAAAFAAQMAELDRLAGKRTAADAMKALAVETDGLKSQLQAAVSSQDLLIDNLARLQLATPIIDAQAEAWRRVADEAAQYAGTLGTVSNVLDGIGGLARAVGDIVVSQHERGSEAAQREAKTAWVITQGVALASAIVSTAAAVAGALANPPKPPYSIPQAVAAGVLGGIQVATIAATTIAGVADAGLTPEQINRAITGSHSTVVVQRGEAVIDRGGTSEISAMLALQRARMETGGGQSRVVVDAPVMLDGRQVGRFVDDRLIDTTERGRSFSGRVQSRTASRT